MAGGEHVSTVFFLNLYWVAQNKTNLRVHIPMSPTSHKSATTFQVRFYSLGAPFIKIAHAATAIVPPKGLRLFLRI